MGTVSVHEQNFCNKRVMTRPALKFVRTINKRNNYNKKKQKKKQKERQKIILKLFLNKWKQ